MCEHCVCVIYKEREVERSRVCVRERERESVCVLTMSKRESVCADFV